MERSMIVSAPARQGYVQFIQFFLERAFHGGCADIGVNLYGSRLADKNRSEIRVGRIT
jgi:hypothetical protein